MEVQYANLINFLVYLVISLPLLGLGLWLFMVITPYNEYQMISKGGSVDPIQAASSIAAAYVLGGNVLAVAIVLASAIFHSVNRLDLIIWGIVGIGSQVIFYYLYGLITPFKISLEIPKGNVGAGILSAFFSVALGLLLAALISY